MTQNFSSMDGHNVVAPHASNARLSIPPVINKLLKMISVVENFIERWELFGDDDATELKLAEGGGAVAAGILHAPVGVDDSGKSESCEDSIMRGVLCCAPLWWCGYYLDDSTVDDYFILLLLLVS